MTYCPKVVFEEPNIENTLTSAEFHARSNETLPTDGDKFILFGGGPDFQVKIIRTGIDCNIKVSEQLKSIESSRVTLYVLNTWFLLWIEDSSLGLQIPYHCLYMHAVQQEDTEDSLYLQIRSSEYISCSSNSTECELSSVELAIRKLPSNGDAHRKPLFRFTKDISIYSIFNTLSLCSDMHENSASDESDDSPLEGMKGAQLQMNYEPLYQNTGEADDLDSNIPAFDSDEHPEFPGASMDVDIPSSSLGLRRKADQQVPSSTKYRKLT